MEQIANLTLENLRFGHFGSGILVYTIEREENNDYMKLAYIDPNRNITWYKELEFEIKNRILYFSKVANPTISKTQDKPVFNDEV